MGNWPFGDEPGWPWMSMRQPGAQDYMKYIGQSEVSGRPEIAYGLGCAKDGGRKSAGWLQSEFQTVLDPGAFEKSMAADGYDFGKPGFLSEACEADSLKSQDAKLFNNWAKTPQGHAVIDAADKMQMEKNMQALDGAYAAARSNPRYVSDPVFRDAVESPLFGASITDHANQFGNLDETNRFLAGKPVAMNGRTTIMMADEVPDAKGLSRFWGDTKWAGTEEGAADQLRRMSGISEGLRKDGFISPMEDLMKNQPAMASNFYEQPEVGLSPQETRQIQSATNADFPVSSQELRAMAKENVIHLSHQRRIGGNG